MRIKNFFNKLRKLPKRYTIAVAAGLILAVPIVAKAGFGPNRPVFDWNNPADRVGSLIGPVFNSFIHTPTYGDERAFVDAKDSANTQTGGFADTVNVQPGKEYTIRAYVHNNANQSTNDEAHHFIGVAKNARIRFKVLPGMANGNEVTGYISADNAINRDGDPLPVVFDTVKLKNDTQAFSLEYVTGSARLESNAHPFPGVALPDSVVSDQGALIGDNLNGNLPGCFQFTEIITIKVRVKAPALSVGKLVSSVEAPKLTDSHESITSQLGDTVTWRIDYKNTGTDVAHHITVRDPIPTGLTLVPGSITLITAATPNGLQLKDTALSSGGVDVGDYFPNGNGVIRFRTKIDQNLKNCEVVNKAFARAENIPEVSDTAKVIIKNCQPAQPKFSCDLLSKDLISDRTYRFTVDTTAIGGATVKQYHYNFGDGSDEMVTDKNVVEHTYAKDGSFLATVKVDFNVNGGVQTADGSQCTTPVSFNTPTPSELPNTGAGNIIGLFGATTVVGALIHRYVLGRRYN